MFPSFFGRDPLPRGGGNSPWWLPIIRRFVATADLLWRLPGASRSAERRADRVQVLEDLAIGPEHAGFVVADVVLAAEVTHDRLRLSQLVPGHGGEKVVFDLVVEAAVPEVRGRVGSHVATRQHLAAEEVHLATLLERRL